MFNEMLSRVFWLDKAICILTRLIEYYSTLSFLTQPFGLFFLYLLLSKILFRFLKKFWWSYIWRDFFIVRIRKILIGGINNHALFIYAWLGHL